MRRATCAKWGASAVAVALVAAGCGGGSGASRSGVVSASWGIRRIRWSRMNTNEVQGGKVLEMLFRGLKRYNPKTGAAEDVIADRIATTDSQNFTVTLKDGWTFSNGEKVTTKSFVDAWNYGALLTNKQKNASFFQYIDGFAQVHPDRGSPRAKTLSGLVVKDDKTFTVKLNQKFSSWPDTLGYSAFMPLPQSFFRDHDAWIAKPVGNGPYTVDSYEKGSVLRMRKWGKYPGDDPARNGGIDLRVYTDSNTAYTDLQAGNLDLVDDVAGRTAQECESGSGRPLHQSMRPGSSRPSPFPCTTNGGGGRARRRCAAACRWPSTATRSPGRSSSGPGHPPRTGPRRCWARTAATRPGCAARPVSSTRRRRSS